MADDDVFRVAQRWAGVTSSPVRELLAVLARPDVISFAGGIPDPSLFDVSGFQAAFDDVMRTQPRRALQYASTQGEPELREQAASRVARWLPTTADQVQITSGSQEGIFLVGQVLVEPGDVVLVEEPTYLAALQAFAMAGARLLPVSCDDDGVLPDALVSAIGTHHPKLVYLVPTFQNPSGRTMPSERRAAVAEVLVRTRTPLVEDDPYAELRYDGEPLAPLASYPGMAEQTILLNSASKIMAPGIRIGWLRAPDGVRRRIEVAKQAVGLQSPVVDQLAAARYLQTQDLAAHLARVVAVYRQRRDAMGRGLDRILPAGAVRTHPDGGMFVWVTLGGGVDTDARLPAATDAGVAYVPGRTFFASSPDLSTMRLSFVTNDIDVIDQGLSRLAGVFGWG